MADHPWVSGPVPPEFSLPAGFLGLLVIGVITVAANGGVDSSGVLILAAVLVTALALVSEPVAVPPLAVIGWFTVAAFSRPDYGDLHAGGTARSALILLACAITATAVGALCRRAMLAPEQYPAELVAFTLDPMTQEPSPPAKPDPPVVVAATRWRPGAAHRPSTLAPVGISGLRLAGGLAAAVVALPALTAVLASRRAHLLLIDDVLLYLVVVLAVTMLGGFWPAVLAAVGAALLLNWFFTPPLHTWTVDSPQNLLALLLFLTCAVTVSSVVHLAARRQAFAREQAAEADTLLSLARTVLGGADTPQAVLEHLQRGLGLTAELQERTAGRWIRIAGVNDPAQPGHPVPAGADLQLYVYGPTTGVSPRLLSGYAAQAASARERQRLRDQAGQAEALAEGNRMRTALLAAVSHDLRTPLASVKAAVSTLRQTDVPWSAEDRAALLATIEEGADRLDTLIGNLLDMSRLQTGALQPFLRPTALDEVAPLLVAGLADGERLAFDIPDALPLLATDPGLLERALANLAANALRFSPPGRPPTLRARAGGSTITVEMIDHGPGIPAGQRGHAFEPFQQLGDQHTGNGVGLGLAVAKGFVEALGGTIVAASTPGGGLTMRLELPIAAHESRVNAGTGR